MADIFGGGGGGGAKAPASNQFADFLGDGFDFNSNGHTAAKAAAEDAAGQIVVNKNGFEVQLFVDAKFKNDASAAVRFVIANNNPARVESFLFQAAATKVGAIEAQTIKSTFASDNKMLVLQGYKIEFGHTSSSEIDANESITQKANISRLSDNPAAVSCIMKPNENIISFSDQISTQTLLFTFWRNAYTRGNRRECSRVVRLSRTNGACECAIYFSPFSSPNRPNTRTKKRARDQIFLTIIKS